MATRTERRESFNPSYVGVRHDILQLLPADARTFLDVGCATGELGRALKSERPAVNVVGVEHDPIMAKVAEQYLDEVVCGDVHQIDALMEGISMKKFDVIVCGDILEHLSDPWKITRDLACLLEDDGILVVSLPNIGHLSTHFNLLFRKTWPYRSRGIHDATHLRFFSFQNVISLLVQANLTVVDIKRNFRLMDRPGKINKIARFLAVPGLRDPLTYQYLVIAKPSTDAIRPIESKWTMP
jgi:2-polyprenyl-3-methyl-5-hydroxy-6-metoxy-1,4-benzoquinol methylase